MEVSEQTICLLDALPEVTALLESDELERARADLVAPVILHDEGAWPTPHPDIFDPLALGILVMEGLMARHVRLGETTSTELVGPGDLLRPPEYEATGDVRFPSGIAFTVLERAQLAILDREVTAAICRWQPVVTWIATSAVRRSFALAELLALSHLRRVDSRLLVLFWQLAVRFGRVQPEGVAVPLRLTHEMLGRVVGAQRPSVTTALSQLEADGRVSRREGGGWLLHGEPPDDLERLR